MSHRHVHPWLFLVLMIPFGVVSGYATVTLVAQLNKAGVSINDIAALGSLGALPHTLKFFWSPAVDITLSPKKWYLLSTLFTAAGIATLGFFPAAESGLTALKCAVFLGNLASTVVGMAVDTLMAYGVPDELKGRAGGWASAGNLGGASIGGGLGLYMVQRVPAPWMASSFVATLCFCCCIALLFISSPARALTGSRIVPLITESLRDLWKTVCERRGLLALILCFLPLGIGASSQLWSALAPEWHTSDDQVATVTGLLGGAVSAAGCLVGGFICDRRNRQASYVWFGIFVALSGIAMALLPRTPAMFTLCTLLFSFTTGLSWTGYTAFVLEAIGKGAAATKFSAFASLANAPIAYMNSFNGFTQTQWGTKAMLLIEAAMGALGAVLFIVSTKWLLARGTSGEPVQTTLPRENLEPQPELSAAEVRIDPNE